MKEDKKVPPLPATDGLPVWAQILVSILVCIATLAVAFKGYFGKDAKEAKDSALAVALHPSVILDNQHALSKGLRDLEREVCDMAEELRENRLAIRRSNENAERLVSSLDHNSRALDRHAARLNEYKAKD